MKHYLGICLVLLTLAGIVFLAIHSCVSTASQAVADVRNAFASVLQVQPQISVDQHVTQTQTAPIAELAVVTNEQLVSLNYSEHFVLWSIQVPLTEKKMSVESTYRIKAGFDLHEPFTVRIDSKTGKITASLPHAKILSVDQIGDFVYHGDDAMLNRINDQDRAKILNDLKNAAHQSAELSTLRQDAEKQVTARLQELISPQAGSMELRWNEPALSSGGPKK